ncbi:hypothetical protein [Mesorhizobium amorphae]|uniref:hypothetical protein n=1 Tax=Mesorhizobium amorphae TaxID=71433 RepID=UPI00177ABA76|nr:hypothetical protein [Mesorhizobium amorphae]
MNGIRGIFVVALECALVHAGLAHAAYEFQAALKRTLADPTVEQRWLNGEDVFAGLPEDPKAPGEVAARQSFMLYGCGSFLTVVIVIVPLYIAANHHIDARWRRLALHAARRHGRIQCLVGAFARVGSAAGETADSS